MLMISIPKTEMEALSGAGHPCKINGEQVMLRLVDGFLCYRDDEQENRCKVLMREEQPNGVISFVAASHGEEDKPHALIGMDENGEVGNLLAPLPGLPGGSKLN